MKKIAKTFEELKTIDFKEIVSKKYFLKVDKNSDFQNLTICEDILLLMDHFQLCTNPQKQIFGNILDRKDIKHFKIQNLPKNKHTYSTNVVYLESFNIYQSGFEYVNFYSDVNHYYLTVDKIQKCSVFFYKDENNNNIDDYPIYELFKLYETRRTKRIETEKSENIKTFEMRMVMMGLQGFLDIPKFELRELSTYYKIQKRIYLHNNGFEITANDIKSYDENKFNILNKRQGINIKNLSHRQLKILLTSFKEIGYL